ncbi:MAG TPA: citrate/2-methylcitrate synthase [Candidatus Saccharimonadales bacterium]|nr:citrate/2-methylcitrate synthase [Candidatus Saccharimonadales bacterium]
MTIADLRTQDMKVICLGSHPGIIQSILDYDFLVKKQQPSIMAIVAGGRKQERYFWGESEVIIPVVPKLSALPEVKRAQVSAVLNVQSARRVLASTKEALELLPNVRVAAVFAEQTPEVHSVQLARAAKERGVLLIGPSSVGLLLPGFAKLGAIGGTQHLQLSEAGILDYGDTAVVSTSGGIVNELIHTVTGSGLGVSFGLAVGGDRFPMTTPAEAMLLAEADKATKRIVFFGELGGTDEYEIAQLIKDKKLTKEIIVYIAGTVAELFETPPQFGHAKALAETHDESASAKKDALRDVGVVVCETFADIAKELKARVGGERTVTDARIGERKKSLIVSHVSGDVDGDVHILGKELLRTVEENTVASMTLSMLLGRPVTSKKAIEFTDYVLRLLVDHGPYVSGAVNTIVSARAGKDLVSSLAAGLLTIGPRFGGAINAASGNWLEGATSGDTPREFVEKYRGIIPGIGHKKYRIDLPDPRVEALVGFTSNSNGDKYFTFARGVEKVTTTKKGNLILNVDGAIAAILLDILESEMGYSHEELKELVEIEFFNALFVLARSVGFSAHYLDQRRHDEGLLRLSPNEIRYIGE